MKKTIITDMLFFLLRLLVFVLMCMMSVYMICTNEFLLEELFGMFVSDVPAVVLNVILCYVIPVPAYLLVCGYDPYARRKFVQKYDILPSKARFFTDVLKLPFVWIELLLCLAVLACTGFCTPIGTLLFADVPVFMSIFVWALPLVFFLLPASSMIYRGWVRDAEMMTKSEKEELATSKRIFGGFSPLKLILNVVYFLAGTYIMPDIIIGFLAFALAGQVVVPYASTIAMGIVYLIVAVIVIRIIRVVLARMKLKKRLYAICRDRGYTISKNKLGISFMKRFSGIDEYIVDERYAVSLLVVMNKWMHLYFTQKGEYRYLLKVWVIRFFLPRHKLYRSAQVGDGKRVLLLSKEPETIAYGDADKAYSVYNGGSFNGLTVYSVDAFCNYLDRLALTEPKQRRRFDD